MKVNSLEELYVEELRDLYSAEKQILKGLATTIEAVNDPKFKEALTGHLAETRGQKERLGEIFKSLEMSPEGNTCEATEGLLKEVEEIISETNQGWLRDIAITGAAQRIEHYEQAAYQSAIRLAESLDYPEHAEDLRMSLQEETAAGEKVNGIGEQLCTDNQPNVVAGAVINLGE